MDNFLTNIDDEDLELAKKRIWNRMQSKLPERGLSPYQPVVNALKASKSDVEWSRLAKAQVKERLLTQLPEREMTAWSFNFTRRGFAAVTLSAFFTFLFIPVFQGPQLALASTVNVLEVAQGRVFVNGALIEGSTLIKQGDTVVTEQGAMAHLKMMDDSRLTLGPDTRVVLSEVEVNPLNGRDSHIVLNQMEGRVWTQVVNLVDDGSALTLRFPDGEIVLTQRATVDLRVDADETELQVVQNLVELEVSQGEKYAGTLGQGARMYLADRLELDKNESTAQNDVWWSFNQAYGKDYLRHLDESYANESIKRVVILPGNPLYVFKTFRETVREKLAFTNEARQELVAYHAQKRLDEAQVFIQGGDLEGAETLMKEYNQKLAQLDEATVKSAHLDEAEKNLIGLTASQKLRLVPELLEAGDLESAAAHLKEFQTESRDLLVELEDLDLEDRQAAVSQLLQEKLKDLQMIRVIASMSDQTDADFEAVEAGLLEELNMMVLSLREKSLENLSNFFEETAYDLQQQEDVYTRLMDTANLTPELSEQFQEVKAEIATRDQGILIDVNAVKEEDTEVVDTRFLDLTHTDESENQPQSSKE